jgi:hypothetical protein
MAILTFSVASLVLPGAEQLPDRPTVPLAIAAITVFVSFPVVGFVIAMRRPDNPIGWLFLTLGVTFAVGFFATDYVWRTLLFDLSLPLVGLIGWVGEWSFSLSIGLVFTWLPMLFPSGLLPGRRWRTLFWTASVVIALGVGASAVYPGPIETYDGAISPPVEAPVALAGVLGLVAELYTPLVLILGGVALTSLSIKFRRGGATERQQLKWFGLANATFILAIAVAIVTLIEPLFVVALFAAASIPISAGIAILRYRLYDIDRLISRTIGWAVVTSVLVAVFVGLVVGLQTALAGLTQGDTMAVAASTLIAFALFQPVRRRVQRVVDRRFDRARYDAERTAAAFAERLRSEVGLAGVESDIAATVQTALLPASVGVWLRPPEPER